MLNHLIGARQVAAGFSEATQRGVDLLFENSSTRELISIYFLYENDPLLPSRMFGGAVSVFQAYGRYPRQFGLYFGSAPLTMTSQLDDPDSASNYTIVDVREFEAEALLKSRRPADVVLAILGRNSERPATIRRILRRIAKLKSPEQEDALTKLFVLAGLRNLRHVLKTEAERMSINLDILDQEIFNEFHGERIALQQGIEKGRGEEALSLLQRQIAARFGPLSGATQRRLAKLTLPELEALATRILTAKNLRSLFES